MLKGRAGGALERTELMHLALEEPEPTGGRCREPGRRDAMRAALLRQMKDAPVLLGPACGVVAFRHRERGAGGRAIIGLLEAMAPLTW